MTTQQRQVANLVNHNGDPLFAIDPAARPRRRRIDNYMVNPNTGLGMAGRDNTLDISTRAGYISDQEAEEIYIASALAAKAANIPVEDALMRWRTFEGEAAETFKEIEKRYKVKEMISKAAKDGRVYGTALLVMRLADDAWEEPLNFDGLHPGMLRGLTPVDRRAISNVQIDTDLLSPTYGEAQSYDITFPRNYQTYRVHASRCLRFDGLISNSTRDYYRNSRWGLGISIFVRLAEQLDMLSVSLQSLAHLETEAGMPVLGLKGYQDIVAQIEAGSGEGSALNKIKEIHENRSMYHMTIMDADDLYHRLDVSFAGRPQLLEQYKVMLSAATDIPVTRLFGQSPGGLNATGDSDSKNYAIRISEIQETVYDPVVRILDMVLARVSGMWEPPKFTWSPLLDLSEAEQSSNRGIEVDYLVKAVGSKPIMTVPEARYQLSRSHGMEWLDNGQTPPELVEPPPPAEANPELSALPGGIPMGPPPSLPPGGGMGDPPPIGEEPFVEGDFQELPPDELGMPMGEGELLPEEVAAAAIAQQFAPERYGFRDYVEG